MRRRVGWIDRKGDIAVEPEWDDATPFGSGGMAAVAKDDKIGWIDRGGELVIPLVWDRIHWASWVPFETFDSEGWAIVRQNGRCGWIDRQGKVQIDFQWENVGRFDPGGMAPVMGSDEKWGWIDREGKVVIEPRWEAVNDFDAEGMALVSEGESWGWIDRSGKVVIQPMWDDAEDFDEGGLANVYHLDSGTETWIDRSGKPLILPGWEPLRESEIPLSEHFVVDGVHYKNTTPEKIRGFDEFGLASIIDYTKDDTRSGSNSGNLTTTVINRSGEVVFSVPGKLGEFDSAGIAVLEEEGGEDIGRAFKPTAMINMEGEEIRRFPDGGIWTQPFYMNGLPWDDAPGHIVVTAAVERPWFDKAYHWLTVDLLGFEESDEDKQSRAQPYYACHCYAPDGDLIWSSAHLPFEIRSYLTIGVAAIVAIFSMPKLGWRRRAGS